MYPVCVVVKLHVPCQLYKKYRLLHNNTFILKLYHWQQLKLYLGPAVLKTSCIPNILALSSHLVYNQKIFLFLWSCLDVQFG